MPAIFDAGRLPADMSHEQTQQLMLQGMAAMMEQVGQLTDAVLAQGQELARLNRALSTVRVSRSQELALQDAIRARAKELARLEAMPAGSEKRISAAIRTTLREITGARAVGDIQASQFDRAMEMVSGWRLNGQLRKIRRAMEEAKPPTLAVLKEGGRHEAKN